MHVRFAARTDIGKLRGENQDAVLVRGLVSAQDATVSGAAVLGKFDRPVVFGVFDGLGGHAGGAVASRLAAMVVGATDGLRTVRALTTCLARANAVIHEEGHRRPELAGMGTTAVVLSVSAGGFAVASVGDSTALRVTGVGVEELTSPDRVPDPRAPGATLLSQAIGPDQGVDVHTSTHQLRTPMRFLLATDGLTDVVAPADVRRILTGPGALEDVVAHLITAAHDAGAPDNVSVVLIDVEA